MRVATLLVSLGGGILTACVVICFLNPQPSFDALLRPAVLPLGIGVGALVGFIVWPLIYFGLRKANLWLAVPTLYIITVVGSVIFREYLIGPPVSLLIALMFCWGVFSQHED
jgi:ABC-type microcin C transport system permease subunit YejE